MADPWMTLLTGSVSGVTASIMTLVTSRILQKERVALHIEWKWIPARDGGQVEAPILMVQNLSQHRIWIADISLGSGLFFLRKSPWPISYDNPQDLKFPYDIDPHQIRWFELEERTILQRLKTSWRIGRILGRTIGRPRAKILVRTVSGAKRSITAEHAIGWSDRPAWLKSPWWRFLT
ncbi:MAG TPA: hypothetical protein VF503_01420 [Sphingobium sp.]|uniref:hypothetical protein n=1 Tax=Sphingobium sp. TaxID=1912891 RepID=UPI002ED48105